VDNGPILTKLIAESPGRVVNVPPGKYYFTTAPQVKHQSWAIIGPAPVHVGYGQPWGVSDSAAATFWYKGDGTFIDVPYDLPVTTKHQGPYIITNLLIVADSPNANGINFGNYADDKKGGMQTKGIHIEGVTVWLSKQQWAEEPNNLGFVQADTTINRTSYRGFGLRATKAYRMVVRDCDIRGGFVGVNLKNCDRPALANVHAHLCEIGFWSHRADRLRGASVPGTWDVYTEDCPGVGLMSDSGLVHNFRAETGWHNIGEFDCPFHWSIEANSEWLQVHSATGKDAQDYFEPHFPIKIRADDGRAYFLLIDKVEETQLRVANATYQCRFDEPMAGPVLKRYFGHAFLIEGPKAQLAGGQVWGLNTRHTNLPIGFVALRIGRSTIHGGGAIWGKFDRSNAVAVIGHNQGHPRHNPVLDYIGGANDYAPMPSDFVKRIP
jgi:hypothetical protein